MSEIAGPAAIALASLCPDDVNFLRSLPKAELHAHLNGSIPIKTILELAQQYSPPSSAQAIENKAIADTIDKLKSGVSLNEISDFFLLFPAIYALTSTPKAVTIATRAVLQSFLNPAGDGVEQPQCTYLELRTTPRCTTHMMRETYLSAVLDEVEMYPATKAALIVSIDRRMGDSDIEECINLAIELKNRGRRVVGIDVCGDPRSGNMKLFTDHILRAKGAGLGLTVHIAETTENTVDDCLTLLGWRPDRLGHATFLSDELKAFVFADIPQPGDYDSLPDCTPSATNTHAVRNPYPSRHARIQLRAAIEAIEEVLKEGGPPDRWDRKGRYQPCIEICLSSNLLCKTVASLDAHHIRYYLKNDHPIVICTDDTLPFRTSCLGEYALLLAQPPLGLGLSRDDVARVAQMGMDAAFLRPRD
ncbi:Metallo-dependent hydrolase [Suillus paluster]|uniref:Metallo-dependent hydrolase n=1 Tax=Suillus paluster TaxID=48578 RepID=UPI001B87EC74|nr:Metallo-dependent hydrolase [Suillus paluster]KAG1741881.1 Metallo-dependent hydrolase [Suillus paluster]